MTQRIISTLYKGHEHPYYATVNCGERDRFFRRQVYDRDRGICQLCKQPLNIEEMNLDHIIPVSLGGVTLWENLQATYAKCNISKGNNGASREKTKRTMAYRRETLHASWASKVDTPKAIIAKRYWSSPAGIEKRKMIREKIKTRMQEKRVKSYNETMGL